VRLVQECAKDAESLKHFITLENAVEGWHAYDTLLENADDFERFPEGEGDDLTMILFTSGTTSFPKGVMLTHDSFSSYILSTVTPADPDEEDCNILTVPLYHIAGVQSVMSAIFGGRTLLIQRQFEAKQWMELVEQERATRAMMVPTMLKMLMDHPDFHQHDLSSLEVITYGAAPMPLPVIRQAIREFPGAFFINAFGQTETAATITMLPPEDHVLDGDEAEVERQRSEREAERRDQVGSGDRSEKIRTYNYPQGRVTDHRIGYSNYNLPAVMDGDLDVFIDQLATQEQAAQLAAGGAD